MKPHTTTWGQGMKIKTIQADRCWRLASQIVEQGSRQSWRRQDTMCAGAQISWAKYLMKFQQQPDQRNLRAIWLKHGQLEFSIAALSGREYHQRHWIERQHNDPHSREMRLNRRSNEGSGTLIYIRPQPLTNSSEDERKGKYALTW